MAAVGERAVVAELPTTHACEEAAEQVDPIPVLRSPAAGLGAPDLLPAQHGGVGDVEGCATNRQRHDVIDGQV